MKKKYTIIILILIIAGCKKELPLDSNRIAEPEKSQVEIAYPEIVGEIVKLGTINSEDIFVTKKNGRYIIDGDVILNQRQIDFFKSSSKRNNGKSTKSTFVLADLWTNGVVYYTISNNVYSSQIILDAISHWEANTTITFTPRTNQPAYVKFVPGSGNSSELGMQYGMQEITLSSGASVGNAIHEIGHALGLMHEQSRADRDFYVSVNYSNIEDDKKHNFQKYTERGIQGGELGAFDFGSIMMYPSFTGFEINGSIPSITKSNGSTYNVQRSGLSSGDIDAITFLYNNTAYKKIYVKFIHTNVVDNSSWGSFNDDILVDSDVHLEFYEDVSLTIPYTLTKPLNIKCYYSKGVDPYGGWVTYALVPSGVNSYFLGHYHLEQHYYQGNLTSDLTEGAMPVSGVGYWLM